MKLKKLVKLFEEVNNVIIWTQDDIDEPFFKGSVMDIPWILMDCKIGRTDPNDHDKPCYIACEKDKPHKAVMVINIIL